MKIFYKVYLKKLIEILSLIDFTSSMIKSIDKLDFITKQKYNWSAKVKNNNKYSEKNQGFNFYPVFGFILIINKKIYY